MKYQTACKCNDINSKNTCNIQQLHFTFTSYYVTIFTKIPKPQSLCSAETVHIFLNYISKGQFKPPPVI